MSSLKIEDYSQKVKGLLDFTRTLKTEIKADVFNYDNLNDINFYVLKKIYPLNKTVKNNASSIESHAEKVVRYFKLKNDFKITITNLSENIRESVKPDSTIVIFQRYITGIEKVPIEELEKLRKNIIKHLKELNDLLKHYESLEPVKSFWHNGKEKDNTIIHFYKRCLKKREEILDYFLYTSYERALEKCKHVSPFQNLLLFFEHKDYPYLPLWRNLIDKYDYRKIDCFSHRYPSMKIDEIDDFRNLHYQNKPLFYKRIFKDHSIKSIFKNIFNNLNSLPVHKARISVFKELEYLLNNKKWISFYTLGLVQAEGLFTDMIKCAKLESNSNSLVKKVSKIRSKYYLDQFDLDYYEFILPKERNKLVHAGLDEKLDIKDYEFKSYDILTDLEHITEVFSKMEDPLVYITQTLKNHDEYTFHSIEGFLEFFKNAKEIKIDHPKKHIEVSKFVEEKLIKEYELLKIIKLFKDNMEDTFSEIKNTILINLKGVTSLEEIYKMNEPKYRSLSMNIESSSKIVSYISNYTDLYVKLFESYELQKYFFTDFFTDDLKLELSKESEYWKSNQNKLAKLFNFIKYFDGNTSASEL